jgi:hypothetical protein
MAALMAALMVETEESVKELSINGSKDPNQKMVKVVGSMLSQVGLAPVMNQEKELLNVSLQQNEQV